MVGQDVPVSVQDCAARLSVGVDSHARTCRGFRLAVTGCCDIMSCVVSNRLPEGAHAWDLIYIGAGDTSTPSGGWGRVRMDCG